MKRTTITVLAATAAFASAFAGSADSDFKAFLQQELPKAEKAFNTKDIGYFERMSTSDFTEKEMGKTYNKAQSIAEMKSMASMTKTMKCKFKVLSAKTSGNTGIAMVSGHMECTTGPMSKGDKKNHSMVMDMWEKQTWVRDGKGWKMKGLEETKPMKLIMDGKSADPTKVGN